MDYEESLKAQEKIKKLEAKGNDKRIPAEERKLYLDKAQELREKYRVSSDDLVPQHILDFLETLVEEGYLINWGEDE